MESKSLPHEATAIEILAWEELLQDTEFKIKLFILRNPDYPIAQTALDNIQSWRKNPTLLNKKENFDKFCQLITSITSGITQGAVIGFAHLH